jgi:hypothetical protein
MSKASSSSSDPPSCTFPDGASCWLCLEEGPDDSGAPLVRDCSCRGHSGIAHLPCLIKYAESKSRDFVERGAHVRSDIFDGAFFDKCPNCKQTFQGDVAYKMTKAQLSFIEREFEGSNWHLGAMMRMILVIDGSNEAGRIEGEDVCDRILALIEDNTNSDHSFAFGGKMLADAYQSIASFCFRADTKQSLVKSKYYFEKTINIYVTSGTPELQWAVRGMKTNIAKIEARLNGYTLPQAAIDLKSFRVEYEVLLRHRGENDVQTIYQGTHLVTALFQTFHTIEALRLLDKLLVTSRRVHGPGHKETESAEYLWQRLKIRYVEIGNQPYQALRYENDGDSYVVNGPVPANLVGELRSLDEEKTFAIPSADIVFTRALPVMLHGLKKAAHLNGEIGDIRDLCRLSNRWVVHLEGNASKPVKVKQENLRIVFDLPAPKKSS